MSKRKGGPSAFPSLPSQKQAFRQQRVTIESTVAAQEVEWKKVPLRPPKRRRTVECFGCAFGMHAPDDTMPALKGLWKIFSEHFGTEMSNEELSEVMSEYFVHEIRDPMRAQGHDCPDWEPEQILQHIEVHMIEPSISTGVQIRNLKYIERLLLNDIRLQNSDTGETKVDLKVLKAVIDIQKMTQTLYNSRPNRQLFYSDVLKLDDRRANQKD